MPKPRSQSAEARDKAWQFVKAAQLVDDPLKAYLPNSGSFVGRPSAGDGRQPLRASVECRRADSLGADEKKLAFQIVKDNMQRLYADSSWGWKEKEKWREVFDDRHYFLLARDADGQLLGLANFRFDLDFDAPVLYCYELQVRDGCRGQGLGRFLLLAMCLMSARASMAKVMVTVFKANSRTLKFFYDMKFARDATDLGEQGENVDLDYVILSKRTAV